MLRETLEAAFNHQTVLDMADSYRKLNRQNRSSPMTLALENAIAILDNYESETNDQ